MNRMAMKGQWKQLRGELKAEWAKLTENDLLRLEGELDKMVGLFQKRYGNTREHALESMMHYVDGYRHRAEEMIAQGVEFARPYIPESYMPEAPTPPARFQPSVNMAALASIGLAAGAVLMVRFMMQGQAHKEQL